MFFERFRYHASATGVSGRITNPFEDVMPVQASLALKEDGGFDTENAEPFTFHGVISFESARALVSGSFSERDGTFDATATVIVTGLNILNMVTADRVVARIASSHAQDSERGHFITPIGSYFENLRIAGHRIELDLATDTFHRLGDAGSVRRAYEKNENDFRDEFDRLTLAGHRHVPEFLCRFFPRLREPGIADGENSLSLVREISGLPRELRPVGHVIHIPGFGIIRLAEFKMTDTERTITMLDVDLGSTPTGKGTVGGAAGNGSGY